MGKNTISIAKSKQLNKIPSTGGVTYNKVGAMMDKQLNRSMNTSEHRDAGNKIRQQGNFAQVSINSRSVTRSGISVIGNLSSFNSVINSTPTPQILTLIGRALSDSIVISAPEQFKLSSNGGQTYTRGTISVASTFNGSIYIILQSNSVGTHSGNLVFSSGVFSSVTYSIRGTISPELSPQIIVSGTLSAFSTYVGTPSSPQSYVLTGVDLGGNQITITAPTGYGVSITINGLFTTTISVVGTYSGIIYVKLLGNSVGSFSGNILHTGGLASTTSLATSGVVNQMLVVSTPVITNVGLLVSISCATAGAQIRYTTNGTTPTASSTLYTGSITIINGQMVNAIGIKSGYTNSVVAQLTISIQTGTITITPPTMDQFVTEAGVMATQKSYTLTGNGLSTLITITAPTGFQIRKSGGIFTGSTTVPASYNDIMYIKPATTTLVGTMVGNVTHVSDQVIATLPVSALTLGRVVAPVITNVGLLVSISCATAGAQIRYTTNGTTPTASSTLYTAPFTVGDNILVSAIGIKTGMVNSNMSTKTITAAIPGIVLTPNSLSGFSTIVGKPSQVQTYLLTANNISHDITIAVSGGFGIKIWKDENGSYGKSLVVPCNFNDLISVILVGLDFGEIEGGIVHTSDSLAQEVILTVSGVVSDNIPTITNVGTDV